MTYPRVKIKQLSPQNNKKLRPKIFIGLSERSGGAEHDTFLELKIFILARVIAI